MTLSTRITTTASLMCLAAIVCGCASAPHAAASNTPLEDEPRMRPVLNDRDRADIRAAFAALVAEHEPVSPPRPAEHGVRWSDVQLAAYYAAMDVEMAIMRTHRSTIDGQDQLRFDLRSANEVRSELTVLRVDDERVYHASATVGLFEDDHEAAARLLAAFDRRMRGFGRKRSFEP